MVADTIPKGKRGGRRREKTDLDSVLEHLEAQGWKPTLGADFYPKIAAAGLRSKNPPLAIVATELAYEQKPLTLRGLMYQIVSAGHLPSTDREHYTRIGRVMTTLREYGTVPFSWIVDNDRSTEKPSSWSGLHDFADAVRRAYRKDFWAQLPEYVHVIAEKDAIAGVLAPITRMNDVALSPIRRYVSLSFAHEIADTWNRISKPVHVYYLGDFDPSGFDLERDVRAKLTRYCHRPFTWRRLGVNHEDLDDFNLIPLQPKKQDTRYRRFVAEHGHRCAELDALPANELRRRVGEAIAQHIDQEKWDRLQDVERLEKESIDRLASAWSTNPN